MKKGPAHCQAFAIMLLFITFQRFGHTDILQDRHALKTLDKGVGLDSGVELLAWPWS